MEKRRNSQNKIESSTFRFLLLATALNNNRPGAADEFAYFKMSLETNPKFARQVYLTCEKFVLRGRKIIDLKLENSPISRQDEAFFEKYRQTLDADNYVQSAFN